MEKVNPKPLNMTESWSTIEEFENFCLKEKERRMNSFLEFDETAFDKAKDLAIDRLAILKEDGWI